MRKIFCLLIFFTICLFSIDVYGASWHYEWENVYVEVPLYASLNNYDDLPKASLYKDNELLSDANINYNKTGDWLYYYKDVDTSKPGEYKVWYKASESRYKPGTCQNYKQLITFKVVDKTSPEIILLKEEISIPLMTKDIDYGDYYTIKDNIKDDCIISIDDSLVDYNKVNNEGYKVSIEAVDSSGNKAVAYLKVKVIDMAGPVITFLGDEEEHNYIEVEKNAEYDFTSYFTAIDTIDKDVTDSLKYSYFNNEEVGDYLVTFTFSDLAGNQTSMDVLVKVVDKLAPSLILTENTINLDYKTEPNDAMFRQYILEAKDGIKDISSEVVIDFSDIELKVGTYHVIYSVKDSNENITETVLTVNYVTDEGPKLIINDVLIEVGENVNLEDFIEVIDESDLNAKDNLEIDTTDFNYKEAGIYYLNVLCHNSSGIYTNDFIKVEVVDNSSTKVASTLNIVLILLVVIVSVAVLIYYLIKKKRSKSAI